MGRGPRPTSPLNAAIGAELRAERARADLTIRQLSEASGVSRSTLGKMLRGDSALDVPNIQKVCDVLGISVTQLIGRAEQALPPADPEVDLPVV